jgi:tripartite-type tricarboxylate transporter receptor subunit TctC
MLKLITAAIATLLALPVGAQSFPSRPITFIVPFAAGSGTDVTGRVYARGLEEEIKQSVLVENRPGGAATLGVAAVAKSAPDGYTLLFLGGGSVSRTFRKELPAELLTELTPVIQLTRGSMFLMAKTDIPARDAREFIEFVRKNPGKFNYASIASTQMMPMEVLKDKAKLQMQHIAFKGGGQVHQAFASGDVIAMIGNSQGNEALFSEGKLRFLVYLDDKRNPLYPDVPAAPEVGLAGVQAPFTQALWAPAKTPVDVIARLNAAMNSVLKRPEVLKLATAQGASISGGRPQVQSDAIKAEHAYWAEAARISGFQPE